MFSTFFAHLSFLDGHRNHISRLLAYLLADILPQPDDMAGCLLRADGQHGRRPARNELVAIGCPVFLVSRMDAGFF